MAGKTVLVTGGTGGIGQATAAGLAAMGARVGITGRDIARTRAAAADVAAASGNPAVDPFTADMSSQAEVRRQAGEVLAAYPRRDVLANNAGGFWAIRGVTADGLEHTFAVNGPAWRPCPGRPPGSRDPGQPPLKYLPLRNGASRCRSSPVTASWPSPPSSWCCSPRLASRR